MHDQTDTTTYPSEQYPWKVKNWKTFQHYRCRRPPWIKLHRTILEDPDFFALDSDSARLLILLYLIAAEADGYLPASKVLAFRLHMPEKEIPSRISKLYAYIEPVASSVLASCKQDAIPETEEEREKERVPSSSLRSEEDASSGDEPLTEAPFDLTEDIPMPEPEIFSPASDPPPVPQSPKSAVYARARKLMGPKSGPAVTKLAKLYGDDWRNINKIIDLAEKAADPLQYIFGTIAKENKRLNQEKDDAAEIAAWRPVGGRPPEVDEGGPYFFSKVDGRKLRLSRETVYFLVREAREKTGTW